MRVIFGSVISTQPFSPGMAWAWMQHAVGLERLGHEVYYVEEVAPSSCLDSRGAPCRFEESANRRWFQATMERFGFMGRACQIYNGGEATFGMSLDALAAVCPQTDLLLNVSGHVRTPCVFERVRRRVYVDTDPGYTQLWRAEYGKTWNFDAHDAFVTVGLNIGTPDTPIPDCGVAWWRMLPPVVLDFWTAHAAPAEAPFTTIASWFAGLYELRYRGEWYGSKAEEFRRFAGLPGRVAQRFEVVLRQHESDHEGAQLLRANGWTVTESSRIGDLSAYQDFIAHSRAEIGIAKNAYVKAHSGWFSDRTANYLADGKPALVQATGFERHLPTGRGLLTFATMEEAVEGVERINREYEAHCRAAREIAAEFLDYRKVLPGLLEACSATTRGA